MYKTIILLTFLTLFLCSCIGTQRMNTGRVVPSGHHQISWGIGPDILYDCMLDAATDPATGNVWCESEGNSYLGSNDTIKRYYYPSVSREYRVGLRNKWGPLRGLDAGYYLQFMLPPVLGFDIRAGLPGLDTNYFAHSLSLGWDIGSWADNSWFATYAISFAYQNLVLYSNWRAIWAASRLSEFDPEGNYWEEYYNEESIDYDKKNRSHSKSWVHHFTTGIEINLGDHFLLPEAIALQVVAAFPYYSTMVRFKKNQVPSVIYLWNLGFKWDY
jgi:hypothetical protein